MQSAWREPVLNLGLMFLPQSVGAKSVCVKVLPSGLTEEIATICFFTFEYGTLWQGKNWSSKFREACLRKKKESLCLRFRNESVTVDKIFTSAILCTLTANLRRLLDLY